MPTPELDGKSRRAVPPQFLLCTVALALVPLGASLWHPRPPKAEAAFALAPTSLAALNRCVQARFAIPPTRGDFGMSRVALPPEPFRPLSHAEGAAVAALRRDHLHVLFYVVSPTEVSGSRFGHTTPEPQQGTAVFQVKGPVSMTKNSKPALNAVLTHDLVALGAASPSQPVRLVSDHGTWRVKPDPTPPGLPSRPDVVTLARQVFTEAGNSPATKPVGSESASGHWHLVAVPLRATGTSCVNCHNGPMFGHRDVPVKAGDPLGVAVYACAPAKALDVKQQASR